MRNRINRKAYQFYVVDTEGKKIVTGWEWLSDAKDSRAERIECANDEKAMAARLTVHKLRALAKLGLDPNNNKNWSDIHLWGK